MLSVSMSRTRLGTEGWGNEGENGALAREICLLQQ